MKRIGFFILIIIVFSCKNKTSSENNASISKIDNDNIIFLPFKQLINDSLIINTTNRRIDILFNGVEGFLGGQRNSNLHFDTECMGCQSFQFYDSGLVFGKRLYIDNKCTKIFSKNVEATDILKQLKSFVFYDFSNKKKAFKFDNGNGILQYQGMSCNDADEIQVSLKYTKGKIIINRLINAKFFEYDLNNDGENEQYLFGARNCSQEVVVLRISK